MAGIGEALVSINNVYALNLRLRSKSVSRLLTLYILLWNLIMGGSILKIGKRPLKYVWIFIFNFNYNFFVHRFWVSVISASKTWQKFYKHRMGNTKRRMQRSVVTRRAGDWSDMFTEAGWGTVTLTDFNENIGLSWRWVDTVLDAKRRWNITLVKSTLQALLLH